MLDVLPSSTLGTQALHEPQGPQHAKDYEQAYDQSRQFFGMLLGKIFSPPLEDNEDQGDSLFGNSGGANDMQNYFRESTFGEALSHDAAFHPFVAQMADQLLMLQEAQNA